MLMPCDVKEKFADHHVGGSPEVRRLRGLPLRSDELWLSRRPARLALFGRDRRLLPGSGYARGPKPGLVLQREFTIGGARR